LQRGGTPGPLDRILATRFGVKAVTLIQEAKFGRMVSYQHYEIADVPIADAVYQLRLVDPTNQLVEMARSVDISFGDQ
jgi:6-phosphofructokinase